MAWLRCLTRLFGECLTLDCLQGAPRSTSAASTPWNGATQQGSNRMGIPMPPSIWSLRHVWRPSARFGSRPDALSTDSKPHVHLQPRGATCSHLDAICSSKRAWTKWSPCPILQRHDHGPRRRHGRSVVLPAHVQGQPIHRSGRRKAADLPS